MTAHRMYNLRKAAEIAGVSRQSIYKAVTDGRLASVRFHTAIGVTAAALEEYRSKHLNTDPDNMTVTVAAKKMGVSPARLRRALKEQELEPVAKNGSADLYSLEQLRLVARVEGWHAPVTD